VPYSLKAQIFHTNVYLLPFLSAIHLTLVGKLQWDYTLKNAWDNIWAVYNSPGVAHSQNGRTAQLGFCYIDCPEMALSILSKSF